MRVKKNNSVLIWKRRAARFLAVFFVLYALADVTVLQAYCGNETVGIPSYAQQLRVQQNQKIEATTETQAVFQIPDSLPQKQTPESPASEECFCCCSHTLLGFNPIQSHNPILVLKKSGQNFPLKHLQSDTHLLLVYQPPKLA